MVQINRNKIFLSLILLLFFFAAVPAVNAVSFTFNPRTIKAGTIKTKMERNLSALLTEVNRAGRSGGKLNLATISMEPAAKTRLQAFWEDMPFVCDEEVIVGKCLNDYQGYQVRAINITVSPKDPNYKDSKKRELTISLNRNGVITGVRPAWQIQEDVSKMLENSGGVSDTRQRLEILKWVEDFRNYYNERNLNALEQIYSDDALIITGSVVKRRKNTGDGGVKIENTVKYNVKSKAEYIESLRGKFASSRYLHVEFDHISIVMSGSKDNIYGVTLHQKWENGSYYDQGWLFLLWDFNDPEHPQIHVRTWQDEDIIAKHGKFSLEDFFIP